MYRCKANIHVAKYRGRFGIYDDQQWALATYPFRVFFQPNVWCGEESSVKYPWVTNIWNRWRACTFNPVCCGQKLDMNGGHMEDELQVAEKWRSTQFILRIARKHRSPLFFYLDLLKTDAFSQWKSTTWGIYMDYIWTCPCYLGVPKATPRKWIPIFFLENICSPLNHH